MLIFRYLAERFSLENTGLLRDILKYFFTNITGLFSVNSFYKSIKQNQPVVPKLSIFESTPVDQDEEQEYFEKNNQIKELLKKNEKKLVHIY